MAKKSVRRKISSQVRSAQGGGQSSIHRYRGYESPSRQSGSELSNLQKITRAAGIITAASPGITPIGAAAKSVAHVVREVKRRRRK